MRGVHIWKERDMFCLPTLCKLLCQMPQCEIHPDSSAWVGLYYNLWVFFAVCSYCSHSIDDSFSCCNRGILVKKLSMYTTVSLSRSCITRSLTTRCANSLRISITFPCIHLKIIQMSTAWTSQFPDFAASFNRFHRKMLPERIFFPFPFTICSSTQTFWPILYICLHFSSWHWLLAVIGTIYHSPHQ